MKTISMLSAGLALATMLAIPARAFAQPQPADPVSVATAWIAALDARNFDRALNLLDDEAYLIYYSPPPDGLVTYSGKEEIRLELQNYERDNIRVQLLEPPTLERGTVSWVERQSSNSLQQIDILSVDLVVDALVEDGKIKSIIYELTSESAAEIEAAKQSGSKTPTGMPRAGEQSVLAPGWLALLGSVSVLAGLRFRNLGKRQF